jgi:hypothetical protein
MAKPDYKVTGSSPVKVTGMPPTGDFANDIDRLDGGIEAIDGEGTQSGEHPAKTQSKVMRYI